jgi:aryl-alcohol dehydrogenase-like predicted oxidoreductase
LFLLCDANALQAKTINAARTFRYISLSMQMLRNIAYNEEGAARAKVHPPARIHVGVSEAMHTRKLGRSGLDVTPLCLGGNVFGWTVDEAASFAVLDAYVSGGGNFIDTADVYSTWVAGHAGGESETIIGNWLHARGHRDRVVIATKVGSAMGQGPNQTGLSRAHIIASVEASLRRLRTDYIDLYQAHVDDQTAPLDETLSAFATLIQQGKIRYIGASNSAAWRLMEALWVADRLRVPHYVSAQPPYSLANRAEFERELEPLCLEQGIGVIGYSSLASGFLSGKYQPGKDLPATPRAQGVQRRYMHERGFRIVKDVQQVAEQLGATPTQIALAWLMARPSVTAPIASASSVAQTHELLGAMEAQLDADTITRLDAVSDWRDSR